MAHPVHNPVDMKTEKFHFFVRVSKDRGRKLRFVLAHTNKKQREWLEDIIDAEYERYWSKVKGK